MPFAVCGLAMKQSLSTDIFRKVNNYRQLRKNIQLWSNRRKRGKNMIITGMEHFQSVCKKKMVEWYNNDETIIPDRRGYIDLSNVFVVWSCKTLQNYKCLVSTTVSGDGIYAEYTYNGDKQELYEDVYKKLTNKCHTEE